MAVLLKCPNCGAPLQGVALDALRACPYCGSLIVLPQTPPPIAATHRASPALWLALLGVVLLVAVALVGSLYASWRRAPSSQATAASTRAPEPKAPDPSPSAVAWKRLENVEPSWKLAQAQLQVPALFPEATADQHRKVFSMDFSHPLLSRGFLSWEWGCDCLDGMVFFFASYPTRQRAGDAFIPCLARELGPISKSAPPFDYDWAAHAGTPRVHLGPQTLSLDFERSTTQDGLRRALRALDTCGH